MPDAAPRLPPPVGPGDTWDPITVSFPCDRCGANAGTLTLLPPFSPDPHASLPDTPPGMDRLLVETVRLSIDGPVTTTHHFLPQMNIDIARLDAALRAGDVRSLYEMDIEYVPFWCRSCAKNYCRNCWVVWVVYDESFYDCTRGRCPMNHERTLDD